MVVADDPLLMVKEVAERLRIHENSVLNKLKRGELRGLRIGGPRTGWRIRTSELERFLKEAEARGERPEA